MAEQTPQDWKTALPEDLRDHPSIKDFKDVASLAKSQIEARTLLGNAIRIPSQDAGPEALKEFAGRIAEKVPNVVYLPDDPTAREVALKDVKKKLGVPDDPKGYSVEGVQLPPDVKLEDAELEALRGAAAELGYTKDQFRVAAKKAGEAKLGAIQAERTNRDALKRELGAAFEDRTLAAALAAEKLGFPEGITKALRAGTVDLKTFQAFAAVARGFGETRQVGDQGGAGGGGKRTPAEARALLEDIKARPEYFNPKPNQMGLHQALVRQASELRDEIAAAG